MAKEIHYDSVAQRLLSERDVSDVVLLLIRILERKLGDFFDEGVQEVAPQKDEQPLTASYSKPV